jgi:hypothetical protein
VDGAPRAIALSGRSFRHTLIGLWVI